MALKRTPFKKPTYTESLQKRVEAQKRAISRKKERDKQSITKGTKKPSGGKNGVRKRKRAGKTAGYKPPPWFNSIPVGSHGSNPVQKRYWKVISDFVRQRDFKKYNGKCVSCPRRLEHWKDGDCAHFKRWSVCNGYFKYELTNLALSCKSCNQHDDGVIGHSFGEELKRRHGKNHLQWIEKENQKHSGEKMEAWEIVARVEKLLDENPDFVCP